VDQFVILLTTAVAAAALLLLWAGVDHLRDPTTLTRLIDQGRSSALALAGAETAVGAAVLVALAQPFGAGRWLLAAQASLYFGFTGYLARRYLRGDRDDCGCSRLAGRVGVAGLARAGALGVATAVAAGAYPSVALHISEAERSALALVSAGMLVLTVLLYVLPAAVDGLAKPLYGRET
jgi:methylamine utilization protein MauE